MANNTETVNKFLGELESKVSILWEKEKSAMLELKKNESEKLDLPFNNKLNKEDFR